jgi:hypothetical protein
VKNISEINKVIERFCCKDDLSTFDPYDIWKTWYGLPAKKLYNMNNVVGLLPAAVLTLFDTYFNNNLRKSYVKQEYAIVRALAALALLNLYKSQGSVCYLNYIEKHIQWLADNPCIGHVYSWGLGFTHAVSEDVIYDSNTPFTTITVYALEAFVEYIHITGRSDYLHIVNGVYDFFENSIKIMDETDDCLATSYGPLRDRVVINALSYTMFSYALLLQYIPDENKHKAMVKIQKLYNYIRNNQNENGAWFYSPQGNSFIDCFHSCIVLKNLIKTNLLLTLPNCSTIVEKGYAYLKNNFFDKKTHLFRRFSIANKPSLIRYDLYDNAEILNLAYLHNDLDLYYSLSASIKAYFCKGADIYSQIVEPGILRNKNMLRWAVMPYLHALSQLISKDVTQ